MSDKLKPCPWCGEQPETTQIEDDLFDMGEEPEMFVITCKGCGMAPPDCTSRNKKELFEQWNTRHESASKEEVERLKGWISVHKLQPQSDFEVLVCQDDDVFLAVFREDHEGNYWFELDGRILTGIEDWMSKPAPQDNSKEEE